MMIIQPFSVDLAFFTITYADFMDNSMLEI